MPHPTAESRPVDGARDERLGEVDAMFSLGDIVVGFDSDSNGRLGGAADSEDEFVANAPLSESGVVSDTLGTQVYPVANHLFVNLFSENAERYGAYDVGYGEAHFSRKLQLGRTMSQFSGGGAVLCRGQTRV